MINGASMTAEQEAIADEALALFRHMSRKWKDNPDPLLLHLLPVILMGCFNSVMHVRMVNIQKEMVELIVDQLAVKSPPA